MNSLKNNQKGFSLIEVMIVSGIISLTAFAVMNLLHSLTENIVRVEDKQSAIDFRTIIRMDLSSVEGCKNTLAGKTVGNAVVDGITNKFGKKTYGKTDSYTSTYDRLKITNINLENVDVVTVPSAANQTGRMNLKFKINGKNGKLPIKDIDIPIYVRTNGIGLIEECSSNEGFADSGSLKLVCSDRESPTAVKVAYVGQVDIDHKSATTNNSGYRRAYICQSSGNWIQVSDEYIPDSGN